MLKIAIAQIDPVVGAFEANVQKIKSAYQDASKSGARILLTPELGLCGYPPYDLVDRPEMLERTEKALKDLAAATRGQKCALTIGHITSNPDGRGRLAQNAVSIFENGSAVFKQVKMLLPTYDVFDEERYFEPATEVRLWNCDGLQVAVAICEDLWSQHSVLGRKLYGHSPFDEYKKQKAHLVVSLSSSPYEWGKREIREKLRSKIAQDLQVPLVYVNQVGATDEILFDGGSFAINSQGNLLGRLPFFKTSFGIVSLSKSGGELFDLPDPKNREDESPSEIEIMTRGLVVGIKEYFARTGFKKAILGLSGGMDSSVVAYLAVKALGAKNVLGVAMPSQYSSPHSLEDAELLAKRLGIRLEVRPIKFLYSVVSKNISEGRGELASLTLENLQARLRALTLITLSNQDSSLVLTTGNKSELAMGYCTLYGDMIGALAPIGDVFKTQVYQIARHMNQNWGGAIPERCFTKAPSAELRPNQTDQDTLPPYDILDKILKEYIENGISVAEIESQIKAQGNTKLSVKQILRSVEVSEYKRRQGAPVLKVSRKAFGIGRRIPIAKQWEQI